MALAGVDGQNFSRPTSPYSGAVVSRTRWPTCTPCAGRSSTSGTQQRAGHLVASVQKYLHIVEHRARRHRHRGAGDRRAGRVQHAPGGRARALAGDSACSRRWAPRTRTSPWFSRGGRPARRRRRPGGHAAGTAVTAVIAVAWTATCAAKPPGLDLGGLPMQIVIAPRSRPSAGGDRRAGFRRCGRPACGLARRWRIGLSIVALALVLLAAARRPPRRGPPRAPAAGAVDRVRGHRRSGDAGIGTDDPTRESFPQACSSAWARQRPLRLRGAQRTTAAALEGRAAGGAAGAPHAGDGLAERGRPDRRRAVGDYEPRLDQMIGTLRLAGARVLVANTPHLDHLPAYGACRPNPPRV